MALDNLQMPQAFGALQQNSMMQQGMMQNPGAQWNQNLKQQHDMDMASMEAQLSMKAQEHAAQTQMRMQSELEEKQLRAALAGSTVDDQMEQELVQAQEKLRAFNRANLQVSRDLAQSQPDYQKNRAKALSMISTQREAKDRLRKQFDLLVPKDEPLQPGETDSALRYMQQRQAGRGPLQFGSLVDQRLFNTYGELSSFADPKRKFSLLAKREGVDRALGYMSTAMDSLKQYVPFTDPKAEDLSSVLDSDFTETAWEILPPEIREKFPQLGAHHRNEIHLMGSALAATGLAPEASEILMGVKPEPGDGLDRGAAKRREVASTYAAELIGNKLAEHVTGDKAAFLGDLERLVDLVLAAPSSKTPATGILEDVQKHVHRMSEQYGVDQDLIRYALQSGGEAFRRKELAAKQIMQATMPSQKDNVPVSSEFKLALIHSTLAGELGKLAVRVPALMPQHRYDALENLDEFLEVVRGGTDKDPGGMFGPTKVATFDEMLGMLETPDKGKFQDGVVGQVGDLWRREVDPIATKIKGLEKEKATVGEQMAELLSQYPEAPMMTPAIRSMRKAKVREAQAKVAPENPYHGNWSH